MRLSLIVLMLIRVCTAQDMEYTKQVIEKLTSTTMKGRGYVGNGDGNAAKYIAGALKNAGAKKIGPSYMQPFTFPVNTFPTYMTIALDGKLLLPGNEYIVDPASPDCTGEFEVVYLRDYNDWYKPRMFDNKIVVIDLSHFNDSIKKLVQKCRSEKHQHAGIIYLEPAKLTWSVSTFQQPNFSATVLKSSFDTTVTKIKIHVDAKFKEQHETQNVIATIDGHVADSFIVFTAHYDHLGMMGSETIFPGANDNASGISMLLNLAAYYGAHPPKYTVVFMAFAGEEAGLIGSQYYTLHPLFPLERIKFLLNMDLMGTGDEGITVVNATEFVPQFESMLKINEERKLLASVNKRGKAANSDHYFFTEKGVPSFFIYTMGGIKAYHDVYDIAATLPLTDYRDLFEFIIAFVQTIE